jgi:hypothetical protein
MKTLKLPLLALGCALLFSSASFAQASSSGTTEKATLQGEKDHPLPIWQPPSGPLSLSASKATAKFEVYPNPAVEKTTIAYTAKTTKTDLYVYNLVGNLVASFALPEGTGVQEKEIDLSHLPKGYYILKIGDKSLKLSLQ